MRIKMKFRAIFALSSLWFATEVSAHPHSFLDIQTKALMQETQLTGFQMHWTLDEIASAELIYEVKSSKNPEETKKKITQEMIDTAKNEHYFSYLYNANGELQKFTDKPTDYAFEIAQNRIVFRVKFYLETPQELKNAPATLMSYEPTYYMGIEYNRHSDVSISNSACQIRIEQPKVDQSLRLYASNLDKNETPDDLSLGRQFAQRVIMVCE